MSDKELREVIKRAALVCEYRSGDIDTEDGSFATTDIDEIINLEWALCKAFRTKSDDVEVLEILSKFDELYTRQDTWIPVETALPEENTEVLIYNRDIEEVILGELIDGAWWSGQCCYFDVTHWKEITKPE